MQPEKALLPIEVKPSGMVMEVRLVQPEKALLPIEVTFSPIVTLENSALEKAFAGILHSTINSPVKPTNAPLPIKATLLGIVTQLNLALSLNAFTPILMTE